MSGVQARRSAELRRRGFSVGEGGWVGLLVRMEHLDVLHDAARYLLGHDKRAGFRVLTTAERQALEAALATIQPPVLTWRRVKERAASSRSAPRPPPG